MSRVAQLLLALLPAAQAAANASILNATAIPIVSGMIIKPGPPMPIFMGCFVDNTSGVRALPTPMNVTLNSTGDCMKVCDAYLYFGQVGTGQCFCGNRLYATSKANASQCRCTSTKSSTTGSAICAFQIIRALPQRAPAPAKAITKDELREVRGRPEALQTGLRARAPLAAALAAVGAAGLAVLWAAARRTGAAAAGGDGAPLRAADGEASAE